MKTHGITRAAFVAAALLASAAVARGDEIRALSGIYSDETVVSIQKNGAQLVVKTDKREIPLENVKSIRFDDRPWPEGGQVKVIFITKDWLRGTLVKGTDNGFTLKTASLGDVDIDLANVRGVLFDAPPEKEREIEAKRLATPPADDTMFIKSGGKPYGTILTIAPTGVTLDTTKRSNKDDKSDLGTITQKLTEIEAIATSKDGGNEVPVMTGLGVRIKLDDGSLLEGELTSLQNGNVTLEHPVLGGTLEKSNKPKPKTLAIPKARILELSVVNGAFVYLSDLAPARVVEKFPPEFDRPADIWGWKRDKEVVKGGRLRLGGRTFEKGLGVHSYCELEFTLNGQYSSFRAVIGLDDSTRYLGTPGLGGVVFKVLIDGKPAKDLQVDGAATPADPGIKKLKGEKPSEITVDVAGAKTLTLIADYHFMHILGRADWADAYLVKKH